MRAPVLGLAVERREEDDTYRLVHVDDDEATESVLAEGSLDRCEKELVAALEERYGTGKLNIPFRTLGGAQFWGDRAIYCGWRIQDNVLTGHCRLLDQRDVRRAWGTFEECRVALEKERVRSKLHPRSDHLVLLVHGLGRTRNSLEPMREAIEAAGFDVESVNYPSTRRTIGEHADQIESLLGEVRDYETVSFVTHSLGGIVMRAVLARDSRWKERLGVRRMVMLAPPNRGSVIADMLKDWFLYEIVAGGSGRELTPQDVAMIPEPKCEFGVLAGGTGTARGKNPLLGGDNDGVVLVENTRLDSARDSLRVDALHSFIMSNEEAVQATVRFLTEGRFRP